MILTKKSFSWKTWSFKHTQIFRGTKIFCSVKFCYKVRQPKDDHFLAAMKHAFYNSCFTSLSPYNKLATKPCTVVYKQASDSKFMTAATEPTTKKEVLISRNWNRKKTLFVK